MFELLDVPTTVLLTIFAVIVWLAVAEVRRDQRSRGLRVDERSIRLSRMRASVRDLAPDGVERRGDRVFVDKLVAERLAAKRGKRAA